MHPEILREMGAQHSRELQNQAHQAMLVKMANRARRASRRGLNFTGDGDEYVAPAIPDYVDGSFRTTPIDDRADRVPTTGRAA